jgi:hypothetical protein
VEWESSLGGCGVVIPNKNSLFFEILTPNGNLSGGKIKGNFMQ